MMTLQILVASEGGLIGAIVITVFFGNIKGLFSPDQWGDRFFNSSHVGFYINLELWEKLTPPPKQTGALYT